jgi:hypothetical protein
MGLAPNGNRLPSPRDRIPEHLVSEGIAGWNQVPIQGEATIDCGKIPADRGTYLEWGREEPSRR